MLCLTMFIVTRPAHWLASFGFALVSSVLLSAFVLQRRFLFKELEFQLAVVQATVDAECDLPSAEAVIAPTITPRTFTGFPRRI